MLLFDFLITYIPLRSEIFTKTLMSIVAHIRIKI